jgi:hypothetical protein
MSFVPHNILCPCLLLTALVAISGDIRADTVVLSDDFSGAALDASKWTTILPYGSSSVVQSGGVVTTNGRGVLATVNEYSSPYVINGAFTLLNDYEHFNVAFRTDLSFLPDQDLYHTLSGMFVSFSNDGNQISIQGRGYAGITYKSYALNTGETYFFSIYDNGTNISLAVNGLTELTATSNVSTGNHVAFYSREFPSTRTALDSVNITHVPDVGGTILYLCIALLGLFYLHFIKSINASFNTRFIRIKSSND